MAQKHKGFYTSPFNLGVSFIILVIVCNIMYILLKTNTTLKNTNLTVKNETITLNTKPVDVQTTNISYQGIEFTNRNPADPHIAVGLENMIVVVNDSFKIYDKSNVGQGLYQTTFGDFFSKVLPGTNIFIFDPRVVFDHINNRFIIIVAARNDFTEEAWWFIAASQQSSAIGDWWIHITDATLDDTTPTTHYADFPDVGLDGTYLYLTADMIDFDTNQFQYNKIRVLYLDEIYEGAVTTHNDIIGWRNEDDSPVQSLRVVHRYEAGEVIYFINKVGNDRLTLWSLEDPMMGDTWTRSTITVGDFADPPDAEQPDTTTRIATNDSRLLEAEVEPTGIWTSHTIGYDLGLGERAAIRLYEIKPDGLEVSNQITLVSQTEYLYYPSFAVDQAGNIILQFSISSAQRYASLAFTGRLAIDPPHTIDATVILIKEGEGAYTDSTRWGDYSGTARDPAAGEVIWMFNQYATSSNTWSTWVATTSHFKHNLFLPLLLK